MFLKTFACDAGSVQWASFLAFSNSLMVHSVVHLLCCVSFGISILFSTIQLLGQTICEVFLSGSKFDLLVSQENVDGFD